MRCSNCGTENAATNRFCQVCGTALVAQVPESAPEPSQASMDWRYMESDAAAKAIESTPGPSRVLDAPSPKRSVPSPANTANVSQLGRTRIDRLGLRLDGWADLIDGAGSQADDLLQFVHRRLSVREMPQVSLDDRALTVGGMAGERRRYHLVGHQVGATLALYIASFGHDLYVTWDLFVRRVWNKSLLIAIVIFAGITNIFWGIGGLIGGIESEKFWVFLSGLFGWVIGTAFSAIGICILVGVAGLILKRSFWAFLTYEYNHFRADDIAAMMFAVHHSILEGLDSIGVDRALIRPKEQFLAGRRERVI